MSQQLPQSRIDEINKLDAEQRLKYCLKTIVHEQCVWIIKDDIGCVMLNTEDDDCVPVWPNSEFAQAWLTGEWENCTVESIPLKTWYSRWSSGLEEDELSVAVFPNLDEEGVILFPDEFDFELKKQAQK
jgi:hypothetical protein